LTLATPAYAFDVTGAAVVVDGDTLRIGNERIRLHGIDAPEARQQCRDAEGLAYSCSAKATAYLSSLVGVGEVRCTGICPSSEHLAQIGA
jgi:endonuclease YncB( thermonuclease family)